MADDDLRNKIALVIDANYHTAISKALSTADQIIRQALSPTAPVQDDDAEWLRSYFAANVSACSPENAERANRIASRISPTPDTGLIEALDETGWLIEEDGGWGITHWIALVPNIWERGWYISDRDQPSPVRRVKDSNEALRFARKQDAEAFAELFKRFLLCPVVTEHCWPTAIANAAPAQPLTIVKRKAAPISFDDDAPAQVESGK